MGLPDVKITIKNSSSSSSGKENKEEPIIYSIAGLLLAGYEIPGKLELGKVYHLRTKNDFDKLGVTEVNNPLVYKDVHAFYEQAGKEAELYLLVEDKFYLMEMLDGQENSSLHKLIENGEKKIRLVGLNIFPNTPDYNMEGLTNGISGDCMYAASFAHRIAENFADKMNPFRIFIPAHSWNNQTHMLHVPRYDRLNRVCMIMASDKIFTESIPVDKFTSPAIGQVLGRSVIIPFYQSIADPELGPIATRGYLSDGSTPEESAEYLSVLNEAGYVIYNRIDSKEGYYLNSDPLADYKDLVYLKEARLVDKAMDIVYAAYLDKIRPELSDENDYIPEIQCREYEEILQSAVNQCIGEYLNMVYISIDPAQNIFSSGYVEAKCRMYFVGYAEDFEVTYRFPFSAERENPKEPNPDGVAGFILSGYEVPGKLELGKVYHLQTMDDFNKLGITEENNPLVYKDLHAFYEQAGRGAEVYLLVRNHYEIKSLMMEPDFPLLELVNAGKGRIRLVGINIYPETPYFDPDTNSSGIDSYLINVAESIQNLAENSSDNMNPFLVFVPAYSWNKEAHTLFDPSGEGFIRQCFVMACDKKFNLASVPNYASPAIGQILGKTAATPVNESIASHDTGIVAKTGFLSDGSTPEESEDYLPLLRRYITYVPHNSEPGYCFSHDNLASGEEFLSDLTHARCLDKAMVLAYQTFEEKIRYNIQTNENDFIPEELCEEYENIIRNDVNAAMNGQVDWFNITINRDKQVYSVGYMEAECRIIPNGHAAYIEKNL